MILHQKYGKQISDVLLMPYQTSNQLKDLETKKGKTLVAYLNLARKEKVEKRVSEDLEFEEIECIKTT